MTGRRLRRAIEAAAATLARSGVDSARTDAELLAAHLTGIDRGRLTFADDPADGFFEAFEAAVTTRARRVPLQHITGTAAFGPLSLHVGPGVFIPRPETEAILDWAVGRNLPERAVIIDVCTGSGALAAALSRHYPDARVIAVDDDPVALGYARRNTGQTAVEVLGGDATAPQLLAELDGTVDLVVSNPPYIPLGAELEPEVSEHDPAHALFGGPDGMAVIRPIVARAARWLRSGGLLAVEHDDTTAELTVETICATAAFDDVRSRTDLAGRPRFVTARKDQRRQTK